MLSAAVSAALAAVFVLVVLIVRDQALGRRFDELEASTRRMAAVWNGPGSLDEVEADFPTVDITIYGRMGNVIISTLKRPPAKMRGRILHNDVLTFGFEKGNLTFVGTDSWLETENGVKQLAKVLATLWMPLSLLVAALSWYGGGLVLRPVQELVDSANKLSELSEDSRLTTTDQAEFATLAASLNLLISRVRRSARLQEQFAADAAHELRNPLASILIRIETTLLRERNPAEYQVAMRSILSRIEHLISMVEMLLKSARDVHYPVDPIELDQALWDEVADWAEAKGWPNERLSVSVEPCRYPIDHEEVGVILRNLLDNAARHSPQGGAITITLKVADGLITWTVADDGPGLDDYQRTAVFDRFYRADEDRTSSKGGTGIGLAVVKRVVHGRGGTIVFDPVERGARVSITFPLN